MYKGMAPSPRPCGRGGFKRGYRGGSGESKWSPPVWAGWIYGHVLRWVRLLGGVPARVGGVDLSTAYKGKIDTLIRPRPCGRGGFKPSYMPG